ncbi:type VII secretion EsaA-like protein [Peribacillus deserti]|uniref:Type VII secretion EsaA-like protein n=1 Tax=Peribacillus deserti TaxID=673318 RepID=A0ABS2QP56_9BACI|nr:type VII secretion protein EsaA [Peribacillus deserti]MBM7694489.1 type VII secretion EsaA-like protein [Peribacillus deserti]
MSGKLKGLKIIAAMLVILVMPSLFFTYIGHEPLKEQNEASRHIAVVNDDIGSEFDEKPVNFGQEISPALEKDSDYQWEVVSRSTAEKGLVTQQYDAVVYFPSDFSKNILTFNDESPMKASVRYNVQTNLDAKNKEKVQKELEITKGKMNKYISTLYWSVVSQTVDDIRQKFDNILEKEIAFQDTIYSFYNPNSGKLAEEIDQQRKMIKDLFAATKDAGKASSESIADFRNNKEEVAAFIEAVNQYKEYQEKQNELFLLTAAENQQILEDSLGRYETMLNEGVQSITARQMAANPEFETDDAMLKEKVASLKTKITESNEKLNKLSASIQDSTVDEQFERLASIQRDLVIEYKQKSSTAAIENVQQKIIPARQKLQSPSEDPAIPPGAPAPGIETGNADAALTIINNAKNQAEQLKTKLDADTEKPENLKVIADALGQIKAEVEKAEEQVKVQAAKNQEIQQAYKAMAEQMQNVNQDPKNAEDMAIGKIQEKENAILQSQLMPEASKQALAPYFSTAIQNKNMNDLLTYYAYLTEYEAFLQRSADSDEELIDNIMKNQEKSDEARKAFAVLKGETSYFNDIQDGLTSSVEDVSKLEGDYISYAEKVDLFIEKYGTYITEEQSAILSDLETIQYNAAGVTETLREDYKPVESEPPAVQDPQGEMFLTLQDSASGDLEQISGLITSLSERQDHIENYTNTLQQKVGSVQGRADQLNSTWAANVDSTKKVKSDVYGLLNNTLVDDQQNGYVYDYLANPVKVDGEIAAAKTVNMPPIIMLIIILLCGLLIGFFLYHYSKLPLLVHLSLFLLLNTAVGLIISIYGLNLYPLEDTQAIKWTVFTILLLLACASFVRFAFYIGPFIGWILGAGLILFFITPMLDMVLPNFEISHPISNVYLSIQYGDQAAFYPAAGVLLFMTIVLTAIPYIRHSWYLRKQRQLAHEA